VVFEHGCPHRKRLEDWYASRHEMPERTIELASYHAILGGVVAGMAISLIPKSVLTTFPERKRLSGKEGELRADRSDLAQGRWFGQCASLAEILLR
jgi:DNA-binding transcriptional LysR family regulator